MPAQIWAGRALAAGSQSPWPLDPAEKRVRPETFFLLVQLPPASHAVSPASHRLPQLLHRRARPRSSPASCSSATRHLLSPVGSQLIAGAGCSKKKIQKAACRGHGQGNKPGRCRPPPADARPSSVLVPSPPAESLATTSWLVSNNSGSKSLCWFQQNQKGWKQKCKIG